MRIDVAAQCGPLDRQTTQLIGGAQVRGLELGCQHSMGGSSSKATKENSGTSCFLLVLHEQWFIKRCNFEAPEAVDSIFTI